MCSSRKRCSNTHAPTEQRPVGACYPAMDVLGSADPWQDLWFYANPIFVVPS